MSSRTTKILGLGALIAAILAVGAGGGAIAGSLITSTDIKDGAVHSPDIHDGGVRSADIRNGAVRGPDVGDGLKARIDAPGEQGESAYEIAVRDGFEGTEQEWLASLVGDPGPQGDQGLQGEPGPQGEPGTPCPADYELTGPYVVRTGAQGNSVDVEAFLCTPMAQEPTE